MISWRRFAFFGSDDLVDLISTGASKRVSGEHSQATFKMIRPHKPTSARSCNGHVHFVMRGSRIRAHVCLIASILEDGRGVAIVWTMTALAPHALGLTSMTLGGWSA